VTAHAAEPPRAKPAKAAFERGFAILVYGNYPHTRAQARVLIRRLDELHVTHVRIVFPIRQDSPTSSRVHRDREVTPTDGRLLAIASEARRRRMKVAIVPLIDDVHLAPSWRGAIQPRNVPAWFDSYRKLLRRYARLATRARANTLSIGVELKSMSGYEAEWRHLIRAMRRVYSGKLAYSVNWDAVWERVYSRWVTRVDTVGVDAYFPLEHAGADATVGDLRREFDHHWTTLLNDFRNAYPNNRVTLTEVGLRSQRGSFKAPWEWEARAPIDLRAQRRYYSAYCGWAEQTGVDGIYWWFADLNVPGRNVRNKSFNPLGKPAEREVRRCFR
jgi:hypothetical protein